jgi:DNA gyrase/topoisomerase IV subunit B
MYVGRSGDSQATARNLVAFVLSSVLEDPARPSAVNLVLWGEGAVSIAFDGAPFPISQDPLTEVPQPELYRSFMTLLQSGRLLGAGGAVANALSEALLVATMHEGTCYRARFSKGALVTLLHATQSEQPLGTNWLTFLPDIAVVPGTVTVQDCIALVEGRSVEFVNKSDHAAEWWHCR